MNLNDYQFKAKSYSDTYEPHSNLNTENLKAFSLNLEKKDKDVHSNQFLFNIVLEVLTTINQTRKINKKYPN